MKIDKNIIMDLLPTYLADEASPETREVVESYLSENPDMARVVQMQKDSIYTSSDIPASLTKDHQISAYRRSRIQIAIFILIAAFLLLGLVGGLVMMFLRAA